MKLNERLRALSWWIDHKNFYRYRLMTRSAIIAEAAAWGRIGKIGEEFGEVVEAFIGSTGQNPRKGVTHTSADVRKELLDVTVTALAAYLHLGGNRDEAIDDLDRFVAGLVVRAEIESA